MLRRLRGRCDDRNGNGSSWEFVKASAGAWSLVVGVLLVSSGNSRGDYGVHLELAFET